uniref:Secreted protein n=1 Tax=Steinernema glaseri TaxID=37863 RepID=A0A1I7Y3W6_9BILA
MTTVVYADLNSIVLVVVHIELILNFVNKGCLAARPFVCTPAIASQNSMVYGDDKQLPRHNSFPMHFALTTSMALTRNRLHLASNK